MSVLYFIEITNTLISNDCIQFFQMLIKQNKSQMFAYLSDVCPPKLADPIIKIQIEIFLISLKENFIHVNYFGNLVKERGK